MYKSASRFLTRRIASFWMIVNLLDNGKILGLGPLAQAQSLAEGVRKECKGTCPTLVEREERVTVKKRSSRKKAG